jgi:UDP-3-O-[3-hydroxymyristoyl] glucosamine N-acyltransferase
VIPNSLIVNLPLYVGKDRVAIPLEWEIDKILHSLDLSFASEGKSRRRISSASSLDRATLDDLSFCSATDEEALLQITKSSAGIILCDIQLKGKVRPSNESQELIFTENPRLAFVKILTLIQNDKKPMGISQRAIIDEKAKIGANCYIGEYVVIGANCVIGDNTIIYDRVSLVQNCIIGTNCVIQSGASIGSDGFAFERDGSGRLVRFPHKGFVRIGNNVEISTNCSIARGSLSDTIINDGTKLDALVHVAHNVTIGRDCELTAGTVIGGSTILGDSCWTGLNSTIKNKLKIGSNVIVASGASVIHDVPDEDIVAGVPAKSIKHKVTTNELYLMAGQKQDRASDTSVA